MSEDEFEDGYQDVDDINSVEDNTDLIVYSRDWTVATILNQIEQGNIDLNPGFQRRNAWNDTKRSRLIESILIGYPIPEIVLAESKGKRNSFIVIDGKQRLLTIAGYKDNEKYKYWDRRNPKTADLKSKYNALSYDDLSSDTELLRIFENSALRCTVISNYHSENSLYDIFYRLNAGSTKLSSQELRQALNKGKFSEFLLQVTDEDNILRNVMNIKGPDKRLRDVEVLLRCMSFLEYASDYKGNLLQFLDNKTKVFNERWDSDQEYIEKLKNRVFEAVKKLVDVFDNNNKVGRKYKNGELNTKFNRVLLEVLVFFFDKIEYEKLTIDNNSKFKDLYIKLFEEDFDFQATIDGSTKNMENYKIRYSRIQDIVSEAYGIQGKITPFEYVTRRIRK
ncbi:MULTISPECIES: DUF262 domain-containing protein [unclassified Bacteroides]|uniref:DUF262 domain-containing protein n=1 Tax=unclassified Bacteroides TaxID=2646097 RepID=UPI00216509AF|nr:MULTISPECIES: DUF262 domain-containing protein [unclassified Bacteroides]MCS2337072.1 DUF262 domain-containing protein [Bacteroides sp. BFG-606]